MSFTSSKRVSNAGRCKASDINILTANSDVIVSGASLSWAQVFRSGVSITTGAAQSVSFTNPATVDTDSYFSNSNATRLTIPTGVSYAQLNVYYAWSAVLGTSSDANIYLAKNGSGFDGRIDIFWDQMFEGSASTGWLSVSATDYFELFASQISGSTKTLSVTVSIRGIKQ